MQARAEGILPKPHQTAAQKLVTRKLPSEFVILMSRTGEAAAESNVPWLLNMVSMWDDMQRKRHANAGKEERRKSVIPPYVLAA